METSNKKVLFTVLNWGLGHATRSIPIIRALIKQNIDVVLAGDGDSLVLLKTTFPSCSSYELPSLEVNYSTRLPMTFAMLSFIPKFIRSIENDKKAIDKIIELEKPNALFSDHRYGANNSKIPSILVAHQLRIQVPQHLSFLEETIWKKHLKYLNKFNEIWIPDVAGTNNIAGDLAHHSSIKNNLNVEYIGALSRLNYQPSSKTEYDIICLLSGPEPQRTFLEKMFIEQVSRMYYKALIIQGKPQINKQVKLNNIHFRSYVDEIELSQLMSSDSIFVTRSGYSTLMDLAVFKKAAIVIPTPGQTEQQYLGNYHHQLRHVVCMEQNLLDLNSGISALQSTIPLSIDFDGELEKTVKNFIKERL